MPRIAVCMMCNKMERLTDPPKDVSLVPATVKYMDMGVERDYTFTHDDGTAIMVPEYDPMLEDIAGRHSHARPDTEVMQFIKVFPVEQKTWDKLDVVTELKKELQGITGQLFEESDHYRTEATKCYNAHGNPTTDVGCRDFKDDSKRIGPKGPPKHQVYLCYMCPYYTSSVVTEIRRKKGAYKAR